MSSCYRKEGKQLVWPLRTDSAYRVGNDVHVEHWTRWTAIVIAIAVPDSSVVPRELVTVRPEGSVAGGERGVGIIFEVRDVDAAVARHLSFPRVPQETGLIIGDHKIVGGAWNDVALHPATVPIGLHQAALAGAALKATGRRTPRKIGSGADARLKVWAEILVRPAGARRCHGLIEIAPVGRQIALPTDRVELVLAEARRHIARSSNGRGRECRQQQKGSHHSSGQQ